MLTGCIFGLLPSPGHSGGAVALDALDPRVAARSDCRSSRTSVSAPPRSERNSARLDELKHTASAGYRELFHVLMLGSVRGFRQRFRRSDSDHRSKMVHRTPNGLVTHSNSALC